MPDLRTFAGYEPPPDPAAWKKDQGLVPYRLIEVAAKYHSRAAAAVFKDNSTLEKDAAIAAKVELVEVLERVRADAQLPEQHLVYYRAEDRSFWVYPVRD